MAFADYGAPVHGRELKIGRTIIQLYKDTVSDRYRYSLNTDKNGVIYLGQGSPDLHTAALALTAAQVALAALEAAA